jgi:hypothetical protein
MNKKLRIGFVVLCSILLFGSITSADWVQDNGSLNYDVNKNAGSPSLFINGTTPYVSWTEAVDILLGHSYVKHWNGAAWVQDGGILNTDANRSSAEPSLNFYNGTPYVALMEEVAASNTQIHVKYWNGSSWQQLGGGIYVDTSEPKSRSDLSIYNGSPYVTWSEGLAARDLYATRWNGAAWVQLGGILDVQANMSTYAPSMDMSAATPFVAWHEYNGTTNTQIYVKRWNGATWLQNGGSLNQDVNRPAATASLSIYSGSPYVAWYEANASDVTQIYVKRWNGAAWLALGGSLNVDVNRNALYPSLALYNGTPYVAWRESSGSQYYLYAKQWNGASWVQLGSNLNLDVNRAIWFPSLAFANDMPYVAWRENNASGVDQIYVKHYYSPTFTVTPTFTPTRTMTRTVTPTATVTRTATSTPSITPTPTSTATYVTLTWTPTSTVTPTATRTPTATNTPISTSTPTMTATSAVSSVDLGGREVIAYPNPARQSMRFIMNLEQSAVVKVEIYNAAGERVTTLTDTLSGPGVYLTWNCADHARGAYIARVFKGNEELATLKVALVK